MAKKIQMKKIALFVVIIMSLAAISCRVRNSCEVNHLGTIAVINRTASTVELRVNSEKIGEIDNQKVRTIIKPVGQYDINVIKYPNIWDTTVNVIECDTVEYIVR